MKRRWKKALLCVVMAVSIAMSTVNLKKVSAVTTIYDTYAGNNVEAQNYSRWASPILSYLSYDGNGYMRVQAGREIEGVLVEYYDTSYNFQRSVSVPQELPIFGGFYETATAYFLVTGQTNRAQSADVEVFRITKYDKNWKRIASAGLKDCNTTVPFEAGSLRMAECGQYLLIRTSHEMYQSSDGLNHQANVTIQVDMDSMKIIDSYTRTMNIDFGYVSHSFNQFIAVEDGKIVALDHGDAYPRSLVLIKYQTDVRNGSFTPSYLNRCQSIDVMSFPGRIGNNSTGASAGGFAIGQTHYLIAGNSVIQDDQNTSRSTRNVFVAAVPKNGGNTEIHWLTNYSEGDGTTSTPHMVKISDNEYVVLWSRENTVYYTKIDESGVKTGDTYHMEGNLSDCVPVVAGNQLVWYTWKDGTITFYDISLTPGETDTPTVPTEGKFATFDGYDFFKDGKGDITCYGNDGVQVINDFKCDGIYTYYFQTDGTAMKDRLSYHPDGEHVIYFDPDGHEVFDNFAYVGYNIINMETFIAEPLNEYCYFNTFGYQYTNVVTWGADGTDRAGKLFYANEGGVLECSGWFTFSANVTYAGDGSKWPGTDQRGYANADCSLKRETWIYDENGLYRYINGYGVLE